MMLSETPACWDYVMVTDLGLSQTSLFLGFWKVKENYAIHPL